MLIAPSVPNSAALVIDDTVDVVTVDIMAPLAPILYDRPGYA